MGLFDMFRINRAFARTNEEQYYEVVARELADGYIKPGLMAKAISEASGNDGVARSIYIKLRVQSMLDELVIEQQLEREAHQKLLEEEKQRQEDIEKTKTLLGPLDYVYRTCPQCGTKNRIPRSENEYSAKCGKCRSKLISSRR